MALPLRYHRPVPVQSQSYASTWDPFSEIDDLWSRMTNLFDQVAPDRATRDTSAWVPVVEAEEHDDGYVVKAELPGLKREDVDIDVRDRELIIRGETTTRDEEGKESTKTETMLRRRSGSFYYRTSLPADVDTKSITASMRDGVLSVDLPRGQEESARKVEITSE
ncbi:Hsp20/alpha crystallin family protein [Spiractinospora alimapuensis]|uniref:Hsp20/alpha crystallin family protein n=1 Tax=Spiractinospora alimapuensis TaxID=2820884 RepID=UPI001F41E5FE|nr:Hsp20/alpha crystallin family protein [Spiractinospora alimapuensis]QVQ52604.1 Hsp20/alpha crystallin family protein [Spiractinospora alimapuensis]